MKKLVYTAASLVLIAFLSYVFREPLLREIGNFLIVEDSLLKVDDAFVLGGDSYNRGTEAAKLFHEGNIKNIYTTSSIVPSDLIALSLDYDESELTKFFLIKLKIPEKSITPLHCGTSTFEESDCILNFCLEHHINKCMIISAKFHTKRISRVFLEKFKKKNIEVIIHGCPNVGYDENYWWKEESGLIMVALEYCKNIYYLIHY